MSRKRVVVGTDERGRPITAWAEPEVADEPRYGHMQPAFSAPVERRILTPAQRAWNGRGLSSHPVPTPSPREEPIMPASPPDPAQERTGSPAGADVQLDRLSVAAEAARRAWDAVAVAQTAWQVASEDLARAYAEVAWLLDVTHQDVVALPTTAPIAAKGNTPAQSRANGTAAMLAKRPAKAKHGAQEAQARAERAASALAALARHGGDQRAAAADLGLKVNAFAMIVKHAKPASPEATA